ncbi:hypothetical protein L3X39_07920 [Sabulilitoribacter multivorans]|uniref:Uncharacterized protein n=1 Tax=Flaviramulus multivorans TaxID=1304750 RepID=A0ABS9III0_9FLAO|nr:hypothetical protein [Flaviramulus multivorans]MCF7560561.1 hypothetical protein [Flaviramulus multivorans]
MKTHFSLLVIFLLILTSCTSDDSGSQETQEPITFTIDNFTYRSYPIPQTVEGWEGSASYALAVFDVEPKAKKYTAKFYGTDFSNLHYTISWLPGDPIPDPAFMHETTDGYNNGVIDGKYNIAALKNGCQGIIMPPFDVGPCNFISGTTRQANIDGLISIGGKMDITIEFE